MKNILIILALSLTICSCNKNEDLGEIVVEDKYIPVLQDTDYNKTIFDFYNQHNTSIIYEFDKTIYDWAIVGDGSNDHDTLIYIQNKDVLSRSLDFVINDWLGVYQEDFLKEKLPRRILLLDSIERVNEKGPSGEFFMARAGINYVAVAHMGDSFDLFNKQDLKNELNAVFIGDYLIANQLLKIPSKFYDVSGLELYNQYRSGASFNDNGFFNQYRNFRLYWNFPKKEKDVRDYIDFYFNTPVDQVAVEIGAYPKMMEKYEIIKDFIESSNIFK